MTESSISNMITKTVIVQIFLN